MDTQKEKTFVLYWLDGKTECVHGQNIKDAFGNAGYGGGAIHALDHYKEIASEETNKKEKRN